MNKENKSIGDHLLVFLVLFASVGWVVDAGVFWIKLILFAWIATLIGIRYVSRNRVEVDKGLLFNLSPFLLMFFVGYFIHKREDEVLNVIKLLIAIGLVCVISLETWNKLYVRVFNVIFPVLIAGYFFQLIGMSIPIASSFIEEGRVGYLITPVLTVYREEDPYRFSGFYWEPAVMAFVSIISASIKLLKIENSSIKMLWREIIMVLISQSVSGLLSLIVLLSIKLGKNAFFGFGILVAFIFGVALIVFVEDYFDAYYFIGSIGNFFTVPILDRNLLGDPSYGARFADMFLALNLSVERAFGFRNLDAFTWESYSIRGHSSGIITNTFGYVGYYYGWSSLLLFLSAMMFFSFRFAGARFGLYTLVLIILYMSNPLSTVLLTMYLFLSRSQFSK